MRYVITTVNGTFSPNAPWTAPDSHLCKAVRSSLGENVTLVKPCNWAGQNSFSGRMEATIKLQAHLTGLYKQYPNAEHYVIAHSHGGNVALYAMNDQNVASMVSGVVCLATPFIIPKRRLLGSNRNTDFSERLAWASFTLAILILPYLILIPAFVLGEYFGIESSRFLVTATTLVLLAFFGVGFAIIDRLSAFTNRLCNSTNLPKLDVHKVLIIRSPGDEASALIAGFQLLAWLSDRLYRPFQGLSKRLHGAALKYGGNWLLNSHEKEYPNRGVVWNVITYMPVYIGILTGIVVAILFGIVYSVSILEMCLVAAFIAIMTFIFIPAFIPLAAIAGVVIEITVLSIQSIILFLPFGREISLISFYRSLSVESSLPGNWKVELLDEDESDSDLATQKGLAHSKAYEDPRSFEIICKWIKSHRGRVA